MSKLRIIILVVNIVLLLGMLIAIMTQAGDNKLAWVFFPWFAWPYLFALPAWWYGTSTFAQLMTLGFIIVCATIQGLAYGEAFIWHFDAQSAFGWFISPLYCVLAVVFLIPSYLQRRKQITMIIKKDDASSHS
jgi:hypothetical protein